MQSVFVVVLLSWLWFHCKSRTTLIECCYFERESVRVLQDDQRNANPRQNAKKTPSAGFFFISVLFSCFDFDSGYCERSVVECRIAAKSSFYEFHQISWPLYIVVPDSGARTGLCRYARILLQESKCEIPQYSNGIAKRKDDSRLWLGSNIKGEIGRASCRERV